MFQHTRTISPLCSNRDASGCTIDCNQRLCDRLGWEKIDLIGQRIHFVYHKDCHQKATKAYEEFVQTGSVRDCDLTLVTKNNLKIDVILNVAAVRDDQGQVLFSSSSWTDVSKLTRLNNGLQRSNSDLNEFASIASHDLRSPLRAINNLAEWVYDDSRDQLSDSSKKDLLKIQEKIQRAESLIEGLLQYGRVGRVFYELKTVDTKEMVSYIRESIDLPATFQILCPEPMPTIKTKEVPLSLVLTNL